MRAVGADGEHCCRRPSESTAAADALADRVLFLLCLRCAVRDILKELGTLKEQRLWRTRLSVIVLKLAQRESVDELSRVRQRGANKGSLASIERAHMHGRILGGGGGSLRLTCSCFASLRLCPSSPRAARGRLHRRIRGAHHPRDRIVH
jgi:hypothetical protein